MAPLTSETVDDITHTPREKSSLKADLALLDAHAERVLTEVTERVKRMEAEAQRGLKALALAPTIFIYRALMADERVPWGKLAYFQAERYGLRRRHDDNRYGLADFHDVPQ